MTKWLNDSITVGMPHELRERIKRHGEVKWARVAREAIVAYLDMIENAKKDRAARV